MRAKKKIGIISDHNFNLPWKLISNIGINKQNWASSSGLIETHGTCTMLEAVVLLNRWTVRISLLTCTLEPGASLILAEVLRVDLIWPMRGNHYFLHECIDQSETSRLLCDSWLKSRNTSTLTIYYFIHQFACYTKLIVHIRTMFGVYFYNMFMSYTNRA